MHNFTVSVLWAHSKVSVPSAHSTVKKHLAVFCVRHAAAPVALPAPFRMVGRGRAGVPLVFGLGVHTAARFEDAVSFLSLPARAISQHEFQEEEGRAALLTPLAGRQQTLSNKPTAPRQEDGLLGAPGTAGGGFQTTASATAPSKGCTTKQ
jgi:hypothetical protein